MTQGVSNYNFSLGQQSPGAGDAQVSDANMHMKQEEVPKEKIDSYEGDVWTNAPSIANIILAPYETVIATAALIRAVANHDKEAKINATLRLLQQPLSFFGALGSLTLTIFEIGLFFKASDFEHFIPCLTPLNIAASSLGLGLCALELFFESLGLHRALSFQSRFLYRSAPAELLNFSKNEAPAQNKEKIIKWAEQLIESAKSGQGSYDQAIPVVPTLEKLVSDLKCQKTLSKELLQEANDELLLSDLNYLKHTYLPLSPGKASKIDGVAKDKFSELSDSDAEFLACQKNEAATRRNDLARRVQCWFVHELEEKLDPVIAKLSNPNSTPAERESARKEAKELLETMDTQIKKKVIAHVIGIIGIVILSAGLIAGLITCPYLIPIVLITLGVGVTLARYLFASGYWNSQGWHFSGYNCLPTPVKWIYRKITEAAQTEAEKADKSSLKHCTP